MSSPVLCCAVNRIAAPLRQLHPEWPGKSAFRHFTGLGMQFPANPITVLWQPEDQAVGVGAARVFRHGAQQRGPRLYGITAGQVPDLQVCRWY